MIGKLVFEMGIMYNELTTYYPLKEKLIRLASLFLFSRGLENEDYKN